MGPQVEAVEDMGWTVIGHEDAIPPSTPESSEPAIEASTPAKPSCDAPAPPPKPQASPKEPCSAEVVTAKVVYCLLCLLEAAVRMTAAAEQVARWLGASGAHLLRKAELAAKPMLASASAAASQQGQLLGRGDVRGAAALAAVHAGWVAAWVAVAAGPMLASLRQAASRAAAAGGALRFARATASLLQGRTAPARRAAAAAALPPAHSLGRGAAQRCAAPHPAGSQPGAALGAQHAVCRPQLAAFLPQLAAFLVIWCGFVGSSLCLVLLAYSMRSVQA